MSRKTVQVITEAEVATVAEVPEEVTFSAKEVATELGIDAKSFRRWLRAHTEDRVNKGGRWIFNADGKAALIEAYKATPAEVPAEAAVEACD